MVSDEEGAAMAERIGAKGFLSCSAKTKDNLKPVFEFAVRTALTQTQAETKATRKKKCEIL
jgi:Ras family protein A